MNKRKVEIRELLKDKKFWFANLLVAWVHSLQGQMIWKQRQDSLKQKYGDLNSEDDSGEAAEK